MCGRAPWHGGAVLGEPLRAAQGTPLPRAPSRPQLSPCLGSKGPCLASRLRPEGLLTTHWPPAVCAHAEPGGHSRRGRGSAACLGSRPKPPAPWLRGGDRAPASLVPSSRERRADTAPCGGGAHSPHRLPSPGPALSGPDADLRRGYASRPCFYRRGSWVQRG